MWEALGTYISANFDLGRVEIAGKLAKTALCCIPALLQGCVLASVLPNQAVMNYDMSYHDSAPPGAIAGRASSMAGTVRQASPFDAFALLPGAAQLPSLESSSSETTSQVCDTFWLVTCGCVIRVHMHVHILRLHS